MNQLTNRPTLADIGNTTVADLQLQPADVLALLLEEADDLRATADNARTFILSVIADKYSQQIAAAYQAKGEPTGTIHVVDGEIDWEINSPKKVAWDADQLENISTILRDEWKSNPAEYIKTTLAVDERKYTAWPSEIRKLFEPARAVSVGKATIKAKRAA